MNNAPSPFRTTASNIEHSTLFGWKHRLLLLQMIPPTKRFDISPLTGGCSEGLDAFSFFFKQ